MYESFYISTYIYTVVAPGNACSRAERGAAAPAVQRSVDEFARLQALVAAVSHAHRYLTERKLPNSAIDLLDVDGRGLMCKLSGQVYTVLSLLVQGDALDKPASADVHSTDAQSSAEPKIPPSAYFLYAMQCRSSGSEERAL